MKESIQSIVIANIEKNLQFKEDIDQEKISKLLLFIDSTIDEILIGYNDNYILTSNYHYVGRLKSGVFFYTHLMIPKENSSTRCIDFKISPEDCFIIDYFAKKLGLSSENVNKVKLDRLLKRKEKKQDIKKI
jgi:hypothetical protein